MAVPGEAPPAHLGASGMAHHKLVAVVRLYDNREATLRQVAELDNVVRVFDKTSESTCE